MFYGSAVQAGFDQLRELCLSSILVQVEGAGVFDRLVVGELLRVYLLQQGEVRTVF